MEKNLINNNIKDQRWFIVVGCEYEVKCVLTLLNIIFSLL